MKTLKERINKLIESYGPTFWNMGRDARRKGLKKIPANDPVYTKQSGLYPDKKQMKLFQAWNQGWDDEDKIIKSK